MTQNISVVDATRILRAEPLSTTRAVEAAMTAMNMSDHIYNEIQQGIGPEKIFPDLAAELGAFRIRMQGLDGPEAYILAVEVEQHFTARLREAEALREAAVQARFEYQQTLRLEQVRASNIQAWREQHGRALDTACRELIVNVEAIRREINTAATPEDLEIITAHLVSELHSRTQSLNASSRKKK